MYSNAMPGLLIACHCLFVTASKVTATGSSCTTPADARLGRTGTTRPGPVGYEVSSPGVQQAHRSIFSGSLGLQQRLLSVEGGGEQQEVPAPKLELRLPDTTPSEQHLRPSPACIERLHDGFFKRALEEVCEEGTKPGIVKAAPSFKVDEEQLHE